MEHTTNLMNTNKWLILSLIKVFAMLDLRSFGDKENLDFIDIRCINCKKETGFFVRNSTFEEMITKFLLNEIFHHVGIQCIISSK